MKRQRGLNPSGLGPALSVFSTLVFLHTCWRASQDTSATWIKQCKARKSSCLSSEPSELLGPSEQFEKATSTLTEWHWHGHVILEPFPTSHYLLIGAWTLHSEASSAIKTKSATRKGAEGAEHFPEVVFKGTPNKKFIFYLFYSVWSMPSFGLLGSD